MWVNMTFGTMLSYCRVPPDAVRGSSCHNDQSVSCIRCDIVGTRRSLKNSGSHIDASHSRQPLVKGERLVRYEVNAVIGALGVWRMEPRGISIQLGWYVSGCWLMGCWPSLPPGPDTSDNRVQVTLGLAPQKFNNSH